MHDILRGLYQIARALNIAIFGLDLSEFVFQNGLVFRNSIFSRGRSLFRCFSRNCLVTDFFSVLWGDSLCDPSSISLLVHSTSVCSATPKNISGFSGPGAGLVPGCLFKKYASCFSVLLSGRGRVHLVHCTERLVSSPPHSIPSFWYWSIKLGPLSLIYLLFLHASYFSMNLVVLKLDDVRLA